MLKDFFLLVALEKMFVKMDESYNSSNLILHASAVKADGEALIFLGPSRTGKSTIRRLLSDFSEPLADDKICLGYQAILGWTVVDVTGFDLTTSLDSRDVFAPTKVPLGGIFRLRQSTKIFIQPITPFETCRYLADAYLEVWENRKSSVSAKKLAFARLALLAHSTVGYRLDFTLSLQGDWFVEKWLSVSAQVTIGEKYEKGS